MRLGLVCCGFASIDVNVRVSRVWWLIRPVSECAHPPASALYYAPPSFETIQSRSRPLMDNVMAFRCS